MTANKNESKRSMYDSICYNNKPLCFKFFCFEGARGTDYDAIVTLKSNGIEIILNVISESYYLLFWLCY